MVIAWQIQVVNKLQYCTALAKLAHCQPELDVTSDQGNLRMSDMQSL